MRSTRLFQRKVTNLVHSILLIGGMIVLLSLMGWAIGGTEGLVLLPIAGAVLLLISPQASPRLILRLYHARPLTPYEAPVLLRIIDELSRRAELPCTPKLYYIPSQLVNAFAVGRCKDAAIGVTDGLLRLLNRRELAGVLAHEISHVRDNDVWVMGLADLISRMTNTLSWMGQILLLINLPLIFLGGYTIPWLFILLLIFAPTLSSLLQLALSRTREYDADLDAARLTGDPRGLASALAKLDTAQNGIWERIFLPGRRVPQPSLFRTHPQTEERIRRLLELEEDVSPRLAEALPGRGLVDSAHMPAIQSRVPHWHVNGLWY